jgi:hypothetical protein
MTFVTSLENIARPLFELELGGEGRRYSDVGGIKSRKIGDVTSELSILFL